MISQQEFEQAIQSFLAELQGTCTALDLQRLPDFARELEESMAGLRDPSISSQDSVELAIGIVSEFVHAEWTEIMRESYAFYVDMSGGQSHRHPARQS